MPQINKVTNRVFAEVTETGGYEKFLSIDNEMGIPESDLLKRLKSKYKEVALNCVDDISSLSSLEEVIIQIRSKEVIDSELRLSLSRNYIYARSTFYRRGKEINDIRVIIGKTDDPEHPEYDRDLNTLLSDPDFRLVCKQKLLEAMDKEIEKNLLTQFNYVHKYE